MNRNLDKDKTLYVTNRKEWRAWLKKRFKSEKEVWLVYYKKHTGQPQIPYNEAVEEATPLWLDHSGHLGALR
jgi:uncharacterized protein YdeI (YjbR/CyaY-like superfamily)